MAKQIWKYSLENIIEMPKGAEILTIDIQNGQMFNAQMWVKVDTENEMEKRIFEVIGNHPSDHISGTSSCKRNYKANGFVRVAVSALSLR